MNIGTEVWFLNAHDGNNWATGKVVARNALDKLKETIDIEDSNGKIISIK